MGLRPCDVDRLRPIEVYEVFGGWQWRWSRNLEVTMTAAILSNAFAVGKLDPFAACRTFGLYLPLEGSETEPDEEPE